MGSASRKKQNSSPQQKKNSWLKDIASVVISAIILAVLVKTFLFDSRMIPSTSMLPTIEIGDRVLVSKIAYVGSREVQRGDIIVFKPPAELNEQYDLIKRVVGLPGETLEIVDGVLYINGVAIEEDYVLDAADYDYATVVIPEDCYFVLGDNRNDSKDSHMWINPFLDEDLIVGKAILCYWPLSRIGKL